LRHFDVKQNIPTKPLIIAADVDATYTTNFVIEESDNSSLWLSA
jgi:hypothetical protein